MCELNKETGKTSEEVDKLLSLLEEVNKKVRLDKTLSYISKDKYDKLSNQFKLLDDNIFNHKSISINSANRLENLVYIMTQIADLKFNIKAVEHNNQNHLDHIAFSLNLMQDRLEEKFNKFNTFKAAFDSFDNAYVITDNYNKIIYSNKVTTNKFNVPNEILIGIKIKSFFELPQIKNNFGLDFADENKLNDNFVLDNSFKAVLRISKKEILSNNRIIVGYCYKIETMSKILYEKSYLNNSIINKIVCSASNTDLFQESNILNNLLQTYRSKDVITEQDKIIIDTVEKIKFDSSSKRSL